MSNDSEGVHAQGHGEHALCGLAFDAFVTGDHPVPIVFAAEGELVTCSFCKHVIDWTKQSFTSKYRMKARPL